MSPTQAAKKTILKLTKVDPERYSHSLVEEVLTDIDMEFAINMSDTEWYRFYTLVTEQAADIYYGLHSRLIKDTR